MSDSESLRSNELASGCSADAPSLSAPSAARLRRESSEVDAARPPALTRRGLLGAGGALGLSVRLGLTGAAAAGVARPARADALGPLAPRQRARAARTVRDEATQWQFDQPLVVHKDNGDDALYPVDRRGSFTKGLPHDALGVVDPVQYQLLLNALASGKHADFESITMGHLARFVSPQAAYAFQLEGSDPHRPTAPPAPSFASARAAAEMVELYWQGLTRDVPFRRYETDPLIAAACADLSALSDFGGPSIGGVIPQIVFRHSGFIDVVGPYVSQFLWQRIPFGAMDMEQRYKVPVPGDDYATTWAKFLEVQGGNLQAQDNQFQPEPRYICCGRDLAQYVHKDFPTQSFVNAALYLCDLGGATLAPSNPLKNSAVQTGFTTWGRPMILDMISRAAEAALKAVWAQKWLVHRRVRPEKFGAFTHSHMIGMGTYDQHSDLLNSAGLAETFARFGSFLLPSAYPECAPLHPAYPSGHATYAGACATMLKAFFDESYAFQFPVEASEDGKLLLPYSGPTLTVGGEVNKLAFNVGMGRDTAGLHYRSDIEEGMRLGEAVAIDLLHDYLETFNEPFAGFQFTAFDGTPVTVA